MIRINDLKFNVSLERDRFNNILVKTAMHGPNGSSWLHVLNRPGKDNGGNDLILTEEEVINVITNSFKESVESLWKSTKQELCPDDPTKDVKLGEETIKEVQKLKTIFR